MRKNMWKNTTIICGNHEGDESNIMTLNRINGSICYSCPACEENANKNRYKNRLTVLEFEKILDRLDEKTGSLFDSICLKGYKWKQGDHQFYVMEDDNGIYTVEATKIK